MDSSNLSVQFDLAGSGLIRTVEDQLLQGETEKMRIRAELYKLNVYGDLFTLLIPSGAVADVVECIQGKTLSSRRTRTHPVEQTCLGHS